MRNNFLSFFVLVLFVISFSATANAETFYAYLNGAQEVPPAATTATGFARVVVNESAGTLTFTVVFNGLSSNQTASHIHAPAAIGANTGVAITLGAVGGTSGTITGSTTITPTQLAQIRQHLGYVNVHTTNFGGGEIRGQLGIKRPVDFDGDGRQDYSVLKFPTGPPSPIQYWNLNSTTGIQVGALWGDAQTDFPVPGDYDGDGKDDLAIYRAGATVGAQSFFWIFRSGSNTALAVAYGLNGDQAQCRDFDGDGITDYAIFRHGAGPGDPAYWWILQSTINNDRVHQFGTTGDNVTSGDTPVSGDYDGDGKFDLAVYRFGGLVPDNTYIVRQSSNGAVVFTRWGNFQTDYIVPGDYDGDGKYDYAVARTGAVATSTVFWWIINSSNGSIRVQGFGISSDLPAQGDYDGDARTDIAMYRRGAVATSTSSFWVFRSFDNTASQTVWGLRPDFPIATFDAR